MRLLQTKGKRGTSENRKQQQAVTIGQAGVVWAGEAAKQVKIPIFALIHALGAKL